MGILVWIVVGLIAGGLAATLVPGPESRGILGMLVLGVFGAIVGGWLYTIFGGRAATGVDLYSVPVATVGAIIYVTIYHAVRVGKAA